jgi:O-antigen/teichoic acid export membrane protein
MIARAIRKVREQSLYLNSMYLVMSTAILALFGFVYWWLAARFSSSYDLGIAATLISVMTYLGMISQLGLNVGILRYFPGSQNRSGIVNTSLTVVMLAAIILSIGFLVISELISTRLAFLRQNPLITISFIVFMVFAALNVIIESLFIALRQAIMVFIRNSVLSFLKVGSLFFFLFLGGYGIFASWAVALVMIAIFSYFLFPIEFRQKFKIQILAGELRKMAAFSTGNYFAGLVGNLSIYAIPLILTARAGPQTTAYYAVAMSYAALLFSVPVSICNSLFAEGAANEQMILKSTVQAIRLISVILFPAIMVLLAFGKYALLLFGTDYAQHATDLLSILAVSSFFVSINTVCWTLLNLKQRVSEIMITLSLNTVLILTLTYLLTGQGLIGTGLAWLVGQGVTSLIYLLFLFKRFHWGTFVFREAKS